jgi:hypothetical protein
MMVINLDNLLESRQQIENLVQPLLESVIAYRGISRDGALTDMEVAFSDACRILDDYNDEIHNSLTGKDICIRAYHGTRLKNPSALFKDGLRQLDVDWLNEEIVVHAKEVLGIQIPIDIISEWTRSDYYRDVKQSRDASKGPHFLLGSFFAFNCVGGIGRFCIEGSEVARDLASGFGSFLKKKKLLPKTADENLQASFFAQRTGVLVACDLRYDLVGLSAQGVMRREILKALMYENTRGQKWEGGHIICLDQDVPGGWVAEIHEAVFVNGKITFPTLKYSEE